MSFRGFMMTLEMAEIFYKRCAEANANTEVERLAIMNQMIHEHDIKLLKENQLNDLIKLKNVLYLKGKENTNGASGLQ